MRSRYSGNRQREIHIASAGCYGMGKERIMDKLEKVEKLRERANVSYEEARSALEENDWDLLDAMVALEKSGKTSGPKQESFSTSYDQQQEYVCVKSKVEEQRKEQPKLGRSIGEAMHSFSGSDGRISSASGETVI